MEHSISFYPLLVVTGLAVLVPVLLKPLARMGVPIVVGEIVAGMLAGPSALGLIAERTPNLDFLKLFGFVYLMFLSGLEVDFGLLFGRREQGTTGWRSALLGTALRAGLTAFVVTLLISLGAALVVVRLGLAQDPVIVALILSTTSLGVVMPVLKERGLIRTEFGQHILVYSVIGDFATVLLVSAYLLFFSHGLSFQILLVLGLHHGRSRFPPFLVSREPHCAYSSAAAVLDGSPREVRRWSGLQAAFQLDSAREVETLELRSGDLDGTCLRDMRMPGDALILVITRDGHLVIPRGHTELRAGDQLTLVGSRESIERAKLFFGVPDGV